MESLRLFHHTLAYTARLTYTQNQKINMRTNRLLFSRNHVWKIVLTAVLTSNLSSGEKLFAQVNNSKQVINLTDYAGTYQFVNNTNMKLSIRSTGNQLILKQHWDNREIAFNHISNLSFATPDSKFPLDFSKDDAGKINQVTAFKKDVWTKIGATELPLTKFTAEQLKVLYQPLIKDFSEAINTNSASKTEQFLKQYTAKEILKTLSIPQLMMQTKNLYRNTGGIDFIPGSIDAENSSISFKGRTYGNTYLFNFQLNDAGKIAGYGFRELPGFSESSKPSNETQLTKVLQEKLTDLSEKGIFSGSVLVAKGNTVLFEYACGEASKTSMQKNAIDTKFNLGSINKMFTATAIMQLVENNKLSINDPVSKYLDDSWLPAAVADKVTIHHLLSHTSGLGDFFSKEFDKTPASQLASIEGFKPFIKSKLSFEPGTSWSYSNSGMILLGAIIEKVTGKKYSAYMNENIYKPAGMKNTGFYNMETYRDNIAIGYIPQTNGTFKDNHSSNAIQGSSAGGGYASVRDLYNFSIALQSGKLINQSSLQLMLKDHAGKGYGYGLQLSSSPAGKTIGHSGGAPGVSSVMHFVPQKDYTVVVMSNYDYGSYPLSNYMLWLLQDL